MKKIFLILLFILIFTGQGTAGFNNDLIVKKDQALKAAEKWIDIIIQTKGSWGGMDSAWVEDIQSFQYQGKSIGFFCKVQPIGYIILTLHKQFFPIKAYSAVSDLDPNAETGMTDLIKGKMAGKIKAFKKQLDSPGGGSAKSFENKLEKKHQAMWDKLTLELLDAGDDVSPDQPVMDYQEGAFLLTSEWSQSWPYNKFTPLGTDFFPYIYPCPDDQINHLHTKVGCVATAGAQIMRYWNWPPYRLYFPDIPGSPYDWPHMPDKLKATDPAGIVDPVARLCSEVGVAIDMNYGCSSSGAVTMDMDEVFSGSFKYSGYVGDTSFGQYTLPDNWFGVMKVQLEQNRPILYAIASKSHAVVVDGWQEFDVFATVLRQFHMNYGHGSSDTAWYTLDESMGYLSDHIGDDMMINIFPAASLLGVVSGPYTRNPVFPYFYLDRNTQGESAVFEPGLNLQFLKGVKLTNISTASGVIRFEGGAFTDTTTTLFTLGDTVVLNGIKIYDAAIELYENGSIKIY